jgi:CRISPR/Cas system-associated endoribonuclease Cas2
MNRAEALQFLKELIKQRPGHKAGYYINIMSAETGITPQKISEYLKILHQGGEVKVYRDRFYPVEMDDKAIEAHEQTLLEWLNSHPKPATPVTSDVTPVTPQAGATAVTPVTSTSAEDEEKAWYLVVYDIRDNISDSERVTIYRRLRKAQEEILKSGAMCERIQMSVWRVQGKRNALLLASAIPEAKSRIRVFRILGEEKA